MTNEEINKNNNKKWIAIGALGCGCMFTGLVLFIIVIFFFLSTLFNWLSKEVTPTLDTFFEHYNNQETEYICTKMVAGDISYNKCYDILNSYYENYGKEVSYDLSILNSNISISTNSINNSNESTQNIIIRSVKFEKIPNGMVQINAEIKNNNLKITSLRFGKNE